MRCVFMGTPQFAVVSLKGLISSKQCPLFGKKCVPENPVGPCMVSIEGSCNIEYRYSKYQLDYLIFCLRLKIIIVIQKDMQSAIIVPAVIPIVG